MSGGLYGIMAEFAEGDQLLEAVRRAREAGYQEIEAYSPYPVDGLAEAVGFHWDWTPFIALLGGAGSLVLAYVIQYWSIAWDYPLNVGGRPMESWPFYVPTTVEFAILGATVFAFCGMMALNGLPRPHHPVFDVEAFAQASTNRFFLCVRSSNSRFDAARVRRFLEGLCDLHVLHVEEVPS